MDVDSLSQVVDDGQGGSLVGLHGQTLGLAELCPTAVHGFRLWGDGTREARLLTAVVVGQLYDDKGHLPILPAVAPAAHQLLQVVGIGGRVACVRLSLIPHDTVDGVGCQGMEHGIVEGGGDVL